MAKGKIFRCYAGFTMNGTRIQGLGTFRDEGLSDDLTVMIFFLVCFA